MKVMKNTDEVSTWGYGRWKQIGASRLLGVYWGSWETNDADRADEVKLRTAMGMAVIVKLTKLWKK